MISILTALLAAALLLTMAPAGLNAGGPSAATTGASPADAQPTAAPSGLNAGGPS
jgi:hypothetical protein